MKISQKGIDLIKSYEGIRDGDPTTVNLDPYLCPANFATIGWGHLIIDENGLKLLGQEGLRRAKEIYPDGISMQDAEDLLYNDIAVKEVDVRKLVKMPLTQGQYDALVSFAFNVGTDIDEDQIPEGLGDSTLLKYVNAGLFAAAAREFPKWNKAGGKVLRGLIRRREAEKELFQSTGEIHNVR